MPHFNCLFGGCATLSKANTTIDILITLLAVEQARKLCGGTDSYVETFFIQKAILEKEFKSPAD